MLLDHTGILGIPDIPKGIGKPDWIPRKAAKSI